MKKIIFFIASSCFLQLSAQVITVRDNSTRETLPNVKISTGSKFVLTDQEGKADISGLDKDSIHKAYHSAYGTTTVSAKDLRKNEINLTSNAILLEEITLSANRFEEKKEDVPYVIQTIDQKKIEFSNQPTTAEILQNTGAVFVQKSQMGGGSPVLRGFEANKVLIVVDGVRMNNAIYRGGHLQDVITLDANMLERTEVIFGPASTIYGSDALGGVMHFYTKSPRFSYTEKMNNKVNAFVRYATVNQEKTAHVDFNLGWKKFASLTNITRSEFGDMRSGAVKLNNSPSSWDRLYYAERINGIDSMIKNNDPNLQVGTGYTQTDLMQRFSLRTDSNTVHDLNLQYSESSKIPRYDRLTEYRSGNLRFAEWFYGPQKRLFTSYSLTNKKKRPFSDNIKLIAAHQRIVQERISRNYRNNNRNTQNEAVQVSSVNLDLFKSIKEHHELRYGFEVQANNVNSTAKTTNINTGKEGPSNTRYADGGNTMNMFGVYASHSWELSENFIITGGLRYSANQLESKFRDTTFFKFPFTNAKQNNSALTGNLGFILKKEKNYKISFLLSTGFRSPNVDDMSKVFESSNNILIVPNADLKPEYATNFELTLSKTLFQRIKLDVTGYYTMLQNVLVLSDYTYNGNDSLTINGQSQRIQAVQNKNTSYIYGVTGGLYVEVTSQLSLRSLINYTYGRYNDVASNSLSPLDHIPPVFGQTSLLYNMKNFDLECFARYNGAKRTEDYSNSGEDNAMYSADPVKGFMPSWYTLNIRAGYNITGWLRANFACENIADVRYRVFASGVNAPGRNFIISLRAKF